MKEVTKGGLVLLVLGFLLYANTLQHDFALDDKIVITENEFTKQGFVGLKDIFGSDSMTGYFGKDKNLVAGGRYRPLTLATHAIEYAMFSDDKDRAMFGHFMNALYYGLLLIVLFQCLFLMFKSTESPFYTSGIFWAMVLFAVHPTHTEVVANIKGRDDMLSLLVFALGWLIFQRRNGDWVGAAGLSALFFVSLFAKESSVVMLALVPLLYWFVEDRKVFVQRIPKFLTLFGALAAYIAIRVSVVGLKASGQAKELMNNPYLDVPLAEKAGTIIYVLGKYLGLMFVPYPLTHDYYPHHIALVSWASPIALAIGLLLLALLLVGVWGLIKKRVVTVGIWFFFVGIILYANIGPSIGTFMNERFLFIPTLGFALSMVFLVQKISRAHTLRNVAISCIALPFAFITVDRNMDWKNDNTLALADIDVSSNSAKANLSAGSAYLDLAELETAPSEKKALLIKAHTHLAKALELHPNYFPPLDLLGITYYRLGNYSKATEFFAVCYRRTSQQRFLDNLRAIAAEAREKEEVDASIGACKAILSIQPNDIRSLSLLGELYGRHKQDMASAEQYLTKAYEIEPSDSDVIQKLGIVYAMTNRADKALDLYVAGLKQYPENSQLWLNYGVTLERMSKPEEAKKAFAKAQQLDPNLVTQQ